MSSGTHRFHHSLPRSLVSPTPYVWQSRAGNYPHLTTSMITTDGAVTGFRDDRPLVSTTASAAILYFPIHVVFVCFSFVLNLTTYIAVSH